MIYNMTIRQFCDQKKIPYLIVDIKIIEGEKKVEGREVAWQELSYDDCMRKNKNENYRRNFKHIMINLKRSNYMVLDIDGENFISKWTEKYGDKNKTKSVNKKLPHLWLKRNTIGETKNATRIEGEDSYDYIYDFAYENIDEPIENLSDDEGFEEFDYENMPKKHIEKKVLKVKITSDNHK